ncbi:MAG: hypothetical protein ACRCZK_03525 [Oscillospiraceae bacterium]
MEKLTVILPCSDATAQIEFYKNLGFELSGKYIRSYLVFKYNDIELHFYGTKMYLPHENPSMCIMQTDNLQQLYDSFTVRLKDKTGKIPRSGFPKVTKIRELSEDWRFTITDPSGNTFYIVERKPEGSGTFFRDIESDKYAKKFAILYDLVYSKQDLKLADKVFLKLAEGKKHLKDLDKAKLLLLQIEIYRDSGENNVKLELEQLIENNRDANDWQCILYRLGEIK